MLLRYSVFRFLQNFGIASFQDLLKISQSGTLTINRNQIIELVDAINSSRDVSFLFLYYFHFYIYMEVQQVLQKKINPSEYAVAYLFCE